MADIFPRVLTNSLNDMQQAMLNEQCNCACVPTSIGNPTAADLTGLWQVAPESRAFPISDDWRGLYTPGGSASLAVVNQPAYELWEGFRTPKSMDLSQFGPHDARALRDMAVTGLLTPVNTQKLSHIAHSMQLSAWLHITDRCNLRCTYCFLPHMCEDMSDETGHAAVEAVFRSAVKHGYHQVKLKYAGGEPLLCFHLIQQLHPYAQRLAAKTGLELEGVILSNGISLTQEIIVKLQALGLRLMISLDGMGDWHNIQRSYAGGDGSFDNVIAGVMIALDNGLVPHISITVSGRNAAGLPEVIAWVLEHNLPFSINFYRQNDFSVDHEALKLNDEKIITGMTKAFKVIESNLPQYNLLASLCDRANLTVAHENTCAVGRDYMVFGPDGRVAKCQMKMKQTVADVYAIDPLASIHSDQIGIQNISVDEKESCRDCQWKYWCTGGCPLETHIATGRYDVKSPHCKIYKSIFPTILRLESLRLLQQHAQIEEQEGWLN